MEYNVGQASPAATSLRSSLALRLLGSFEASIDGAPLPPTRTRKEILLLALLALQRGTPVEREWLAGRLWPDSEAGVALFYLRRSLSNLRDVLGADAARLVTVKPHKIAFDAVGIDLDLAEFELAAGRNDIGSLQGAAALYCGPLLQDWDEEWLIPERVRLEQVYLAILERLCLEAQSRNDWPLTASYSRRIIATDPMQESAYRTLMVALVESGNQASAILVYRDLRLRLRAEINADPDERTRELFEQIRKRAPQNRSQVSQSAPSEGTAFTPSHAGDRVLGLALRTLPNPITRLIGREEDVVEAITLLSGTRLLSLVGAGGVGKTRLAIETARRVSHNDPNGVAFVELAELTDADVIPRTVAQALDITEEPGYTYIETLTRYLTARHLLLVLDNCEHLLNALPSMVRGLLSACPNLRVVITSRQALGLSGESIRRVRSLPVPPVTSKRRSHFAAKQDVSYLLEYPSVQLFVERVHQSDPDYRLTSANLASIGAICRQLEGVPLALELAAGRVRAMSVMQIESRLTERFKLLVGGDRGALQRHQTLLALLDWSYKLLDHEEQTLLMRLSVFAGGWTLNAAEQICSDSPKSDDGHFSNGSLESTIGSWDVLTLLSGLVDKSLIWMEERNGHVRYQMLESIREYASERMSTGGDCEPLRLCHRDWYLNMAERECAFLEGPTQPDATGKFLADLDNLRAAMRTCVQFDGEAKTGLRLGIALHKFWRLRDLYAEGREYVESLLSRPELSEETLERANGFRIAGLLAHNQDDYARTESHYESARYIFAKLHNDEGIAAIGLQLGAMKCKMGDLESSRVLLEQCIPFYRRICDRQDLGRALHYLSDIFRQQDDFVRARECAEESLQIARALGDPFAVANSLGNLASLTACEGELDTALQLYNESLALQRETGNGKNYVNTLVNVGVVYQWTGDMSASRVHLEECLTLCTELDERRVMVYVLRAIAHQACVLKQFDRSVLLYAAESRLRGDMGLKLSEEEHAASAEDMLAIRTTVNEPSFSALWAQGQLMTPEDRLIVGTNATN